MKFGDNNGFGLVQPYLLGTDVSTQRLKSKRKK